MSTEHATSLFMEQIKDICDEWNLESNDEAFPIWLCENILDLDSSKIEEAISIGGPYDYGIDIFYIDDTDPNEPYVYLIQAKFSETLSHSVEKDEILSFRKSLTHLKNCPSDANDNFKEKSKDFVLLGSNAEKVHVVMLFISAGKFPPQAQLELKDWKCGIDTELNNLNSISNNAPSLQFKTLSIRTLDLGEIFSRIIMPHTPVIKINFDDNTMTRFDVTTKNKSIIGFVNAEDLVKVIKPYRGSIHLENPREFLGKSTSPNYGILRTLEDPILKKQFWKLSNGITAICDSIRPDSPESNSFVVENFKVVNGRQTTYILETSHEFLKDVSVSLTIHEVKDSNEHALISQTTNTQNPIKPVDLITNNVELKNLVLECKTSFNDFYFERQTKGFKRASLKVRKRVTPRRILEKNITARAYYAYSVDPNVAMLSDKIFYSMTDKNYYDTIFNDRKIEELIIPHIFMKIIEELCKEWRKKSKDDDNIKRDVNILSKQIVRYYILYFINMSMNTVDNSDILKKQIIQIFRNLKRNDTIPDEFINVVEKTFHQFMLWFDARNQDTYPSRLRTKLNNENYVIADDDIPTSQEIMYQLKKYGKNILSALKTERNRRIRSDNLDAVKSCLETISQLNAENNSSG